MHLLLCTYEEFELTSCFVNNYIKIVLAYINILITYFIIEASHSSKNVADRPKTFNSNFISQVSALRGRPHLFNLSPGTNRIKLYVLYIFMRCDRIGDKNCTEN